MLAEKIDNLRKSIKPSQVILQHKTRTDEEGYPLLEVVPAKDATMYYKWGWFEAGTPDPPATVKKTRKND